MKKIVTLVFFGLLSVQILNAKNERMPTQIKQTYTMDDGFMSGAAQFELDQSRKPFKVKFSFEGTNTRKQVCQLAPVTLTSSRLYDGNYSDSKFVANNVRDGIWVIVSKKGWDSEGICGANTYIDGTYKQDLKN